MQISKELLYELLDTLEDAIVECAESGDISMALDDRLTHTRDLLREEARKCGVTTIS